MEIIDIVFVRTNIAFEKSLLDLTDDGNSERFILANLARYVCFSGISLKNIMTLYYLTSLADIFSLAEK